MSTAHWPTPSTGADSSEADRPRAFWRSVGYLTSLGWVIALPIGAGVLLGRLVDEHLGSGTFWTLALLGAGVAVAALELFATVSSTLTKDRRD